MTVTVTGVKELKAKMYQLGESMQDAVDQAVELTAHEIRTYAIKSIQNVSSGRQVKRSRQGGGTYTHTAAAAGQAPNTDTGKLVSSIAVERVGEAKFQVGSNLDYASYLEFRTSKMEARPWLEPALRENIDNLMVNVEKVVDIHIKRLTK